MEEKKIYVGYFNSDGQGNSRPVIAFDTEQAALDWCKPSRKRNYEEVDLLVDEPEKKGD